MDKPIDNADGAPAEGTMQAQEGAATPAETGTPDGQGEGPKSLADAVMAVVPQGKDPDEIEIAADGDGGEGSADEGATPAPETADRKEGKEGATGVEADENADFSEEDLKGLPPKTEKRMRTLLRQRAKFRDEAAQMRPEAEGFRQITTFMQESDLDGDEMVQGMSVMAALKRGDRDAVAKGLSPVLEALGYRLTPVLPADVQEMLDNGDISEAAAERMVQERHAGRKHQFEAERARKQREQQQTEAQQKTFRAAQERAIESWQNSVMASDPRFGEKIELIQQGVAAIAAQRGPARSAEETVAYAQEAYNTVNANLARLVPARPPAGAHRQPTKPVPSAATGSTRSMSPEPRSLEEAVLAGLKRTG